jgi:parvulin-like peptidyl-prolyl isomerase
MKRLRWSIAAILVGLAGWGAAELLCQWAAFRDAVGNISGRGHVVAIANGTGFYRKELDGQEIASVRDLVLAANLRRAAGREEIRRESVDREMSLLRAQFGDEKKFATALSSVGLSDALLRASVEERLRALQWLEKEIAGQAPITEQERRDFYNTHSRRFVQPARVRAAHLFLAAHAETPPEIVEANRTEIDALAARLAKGEDFSQLAAANSEDETTKARGGDLGFLSASRTPPEFFAEVAKLQAGRLNKPFRSHLGFHLIRMIAQKPARLMSFEEAREEISLAIVNQRRADTVARLEQNLSAASYLRAD